MMSVSEGTDGSELYYWDLQNKNQTDFKLLVEGFTNNHEFVDVVNGRFLINTNKDALNYRLVSIDPNNIDVKNWKPVIAEKNEKLDAINRVGNKLFCSYLVNACTKVDIYSLDGKFEKTIKLPGLGTASGFGGSQKDDHTFYTYTSFNTPQTIFKYDLKSSESTLFKKTNVKIDLESPLDAFLKGEKK